MKTIRMTREEALAIPRPEGVPVERLPPMNPETGHIALDSPKDVVDLILKPALGHNHWMRFERYRMNAYIGPHALRLSDDENAECAMALYLSNVNVDEPEHRRGHFTHFLDDLEAAAEEVGWAVGLMNPRLALQPMLTLRGYNSIDSVWIKTF